MSGSISHVYHAMRVLEPSSHPIELGTAIETPMKVTVRLTVLKEKTYVETPHFSTPATKDESGGYYCTTGVGPGTVFRIASFKYRRIC